MKLTCERCLYWDDRLEEERAQGRSGFCCKALPHPEWGWALTDAEDWCGQASPRESGSTAPVHEAAQALVEAWEAGAEADVMMQRLREALRRMKP